MIRKLFASQLRVNMVSGVITTMIKVVVLVIAYPLYLHFLGYEKYGVWLVLATVLSFAQLGNLGISNAVMKLVAEEYGRGDIKRVCQYIFTSLVLLCITGMIILLIVLLLKTQIIGIFKLSGETEAVALSLLPYIGLLSIYVFIVQALNSTLSGLGRMDIANYSQTIGRVIAVIVAYILLRKNFGIKSLLVGNLFSYVFIHIVSIVSIRRIIAIEYLNFRNLNIQCSKRILSFGSGILGSSIVSMLLSPFNKIMLSRYAGVSAIPLYEISYNGAMQVRALIESGLKALIPEISSVGANMTLKAKKRIININSQATKIIFLFGVPLYGMLILFTPVFLKLWLQSKFVDDLPLIFRVMLAGTFVSLICVPAYYCLIGVGKVRYCLIAQIIQGLVNFTIVMAIVCYAGTISLFEFSMSTAIAMGVTTVYVIWQKERVVKNF